MSLRNVKGGVSRRQQVAQRVEIVTAGGPGGKKGCNSNDNKEDKSVTFNPWDVIDTEKNSFQCRHGNMSSLEDVQGRYLVRLEPKIIVKSSTDGVAKKRIASTISKK